MPLYAVPPPLYAAVSLCCVPLNIPFQSGAPRPWLSASAKILVTTLSAAFSLLVTSIVLLIITATDWKNVFFGCLFLWLVELLPLTVLMFIVRQQKVPCPLHEDLFLRRIVFVLLMPAQKVSSKSGSSGSSLSEFSSSLESGTLLSGGRFSCTLILTLRPAEMARRQSATANDEAPAPKDAGRGGGARSDGFGFMDWGEEELARNEASPCVRV